MAVVAGAEQDKNAVAGSLAALGIGAAVRRCEKPFTFAVYGTFVGTVIPVCSFDNGTTWIPYISPDGAAISLSAPGAIRIIPSGEPGVLFAAQCTAFTSGSISYRLSGL